MDALDAEPTIEDLSKGIKSFALAKKPGNDGIFLFFFYSSMRYSINSDRKVRCHRT